MNQEKMVYINQNDLYAEKIPDETVEKIFKTLGYYLAKKRNLEEIILLMPDKN
ncbi:hypothetical protein [Fusobacterium varium]|uniref:hypothetical protein n=1 Tax=Fusobacterium varium TaxID=856 RepID=UPI00164E92E0|nr:hypothetical protein [Fusobacterium varium]